MKADVTTDSYPGKSYKAWIGFISPTSQFTPKSVETIEVRTNLVFRCGSLSAIPATSSVSACLLQSRFRCISLSPNMILSRTTAKMLMASGNPDPSLSSDDPVIELKEASKAFLTAKHRTNALEQVSMRVRRGLVTGLIGPDGAGKTTLMRLVSGLLKPDAGTVTVLGRDTASESLIVQSAIGYMPQRFGLYEDLTVQENLDLYSDLQGVPADVRPDRFQELLRMTGLGPFTARLSGRLSGGMKQKLGLACTLVRSPRLLLLDEPTVGVDPVSRRELWSIVYRLVREASMSVLLSTAYLDEAERCDEVLILHEGRSSAKALRGSSAIPCRAAPMR